jgi:hypothetical protein
MGELEPDLIRMAHHLDFGTTRSLGEKQIN